MRKVCVRGTELFTHDDWDMLSNAIHRDGDFYEAHLLDFVAKVMARSPHSGDLIVADVGANIGNHAVYFATQMGAEVFAFEPHPTPNSMVLSRNAAGNRINQVPFALSDGTEWLNLALQDPANSGTFAAAKEGAPFRATTLDIALAGIPVDLLKIDVEGHEEQVLRGGELLIQQMRPVIMLEDKGFNWQSWLPEYECVAYFPEHQTVILKWK